MPSPATLTVDLNALAANFHTLEAIGGVPVHPVVKADSYGLGAAACATRLMAEGARTFFVARASEGMTLTWYPPVMMFGEIEVRSIE